MNATMLAGSSQNGMEAQASGARRPSLSVHCPACPPEKAAVTELAMTIAEELARLSRSPQPVGIDVPLKHSGLDPKTLSKFHSWLESAHEHDTTYNRLLAEDTTAEVLASDVLATPRTRQSRGLPKPVKQAGSGSFAHSRRARTSAPRAPIFVDVAAEPEEVPISPAVARQYAADIGMAPYDSWTGKKAGLMYGLLAVGLVGSRSPTTPSVRGIKSPAVPSPLNPATRLHPIAPLDDPRAIMSARTPVFASFLDSVRMPGVDLVQSPWLPDHQYASLDGALAELSFPRTPVIESV